MATPQLSATSLAKLRTAPGRYSDGGGLFLVVGDNGSASWLVRMLFPVSTYGSDLRL